MPDLDVGYILLFYLFVHVWLWQQTRVLESKHKALCRPGSVKVNIHQYSPTYMALSRIALQDPIISVISLLFISPAMLSSQKSTRAQGRLLQNQVTEKVLEPSR